MKTEWTRRSFLAAGASAALAACRKQRVPDPTTESSLLGAPRREYGERSPFEKPVRFIRHESVTPATASSRTPLQDQYGMITPSALHFERHHAGVPAIDPASHTVLVHGLVERPLVLSMHDLRRLPSVSRVHFIECAGNSDAEHAGTPAATPQMSHGLASCSEWTGVPLSEVLRAARFQRGAAWIIAEGADAGHMARSIPLDKALDDVIVAYGQNGEAIRPEQGYPVRLVVPGWEGNVNVKWLRRLHVASAPAMTREEAVTYTDLRPDGTAQRFSFEMDAKSVITRPAGGQQLDGPGVYEINGLAWSGRGRITRVEVATSGHEWRDAELQGVVLPKAFTPFRVSWTWNGEEALLQSRCTDDTGYVQPTREKIIRARGMHPGPDGFDHYNGIKAWRVAATGQVTSV
jgi:sulfane dehydrogenase subunit SoxC